MKPLLAALAAISLLGISTAVFAADTPVPAATSDIKTDFKPLFDKIQAKLKAGKTDQKDFADELKEFDAIIARHKGEKTDDATQVLMMKAQLYLEVFHDTDEAKKVINLIKTDYPDTKLGMSADRILNQIDQMAASEKAKKELAAGKVFPAFDEKDLDGKALSPANYKGRIVLVDFWATWCGPCVGEMPNVIQAYQKYHDKGFEIIGVSLDQDKGALTDFIKAKNMAWPQYFDGRGWQNKLAQKYGIESIPANFLLDKDGKIIASDLRGEALDEAVGNALGTGK